jgi:hypothetical protein
MLRRIILIFCFCIKITNLGGQHLNTVKFTKDDIQIYAGIVGMYEDDQNYLWVYGFDGISRYDGFTFERLEQIYPESENLVSNNCASLYKDENYLWIGTANNGLACIDKKGAIHNFNQLVRNDDTLSAYNISQVISSQNQLFIVGENGLETFRYKNRKYKKITIPDLDASTVNKIFLHNNFLWIENQSGLHKIDLKTFNKIQFSYLKNVSFFLHPNNELWIASITEGTAIYRFEETSSKFIYASYQPYKKYKKKRGYTWIDSTSLLSTPLLDLFLEIAHFKKSQKERIDAQLSNLDQELFLRTPFTDSQGRIWIFGQDLYLIPKKTIVEPYFISKEIGVLNDMLVDDRFTYVSVRNKGLYKYDPNGKFIQNYTTDNSDIADNYISSIVELENNRLGLCMMDHFQIYSEKNGFEEAFEFPGIIRSAGEDEEHLYIGGYADIFKIRKSDRTITSIGIPTHNPNSGNAVNAILSLNKYFLTFATAGGIMTLDIEANEIDVLDFLMARMISKESRNKTNDAAISPSGSKIATACDNGLFLTNNTLMDDTIYENKMFRSARLLGRPEEKIKIRTADRFFINVEFYNDTILYATSRKLIYRVDISNMKVETFGRLQGNINNSYTLRSSYKDRDGNIYFGGDQGIEKVNELQFEPHTANLELFVDQVYYNGVPQFPKPNQTHKIPSETKVSEFKVNMPSNLFAQQTIIQGRIDNNEWTDLSTDHRMTFYNPSPGSHTLSFKSKDVNGQKRSKVTEINIKVLKKWYEYLWIWLLIGLCVVSLIVAIIFLLQKRKNERALTELRLQQEMASLKLTSLNSQMNPHFIFNALSSIQQLVISGETDIAEDYLSKFSKLLRHVMQYASYKNVRLTEELSFIKNYLDLELLRFEDAFEYTIENLVPNPEEVFIPPFFIQPQVENAIKHGFSQQGSSYSIKIKLEEYVETIRIIIEDNGKGRQFIQSHNPYANTSTKKGNLLTRERIENLNKLNYKSTYKIEDLYTEGKASGTRVTLEFNHEKLIAE